QTEDAALAGKFAELAADLTAAEGKIVEELIAVQGSPVDIGGYFRTDANKVDKAMRPSATLNLALAKFGN
ncbi:MAG: hypothetical protein RLZ88_106, partial [Actinomycetota bacterium]